MQNFIQSLKAWFVKGLRQPDTLLLTFVKWTNEARRELYHEDVDFMLNASNESERQRDVDFIGWPKGIVWMDVKTGAGFQKMTKEEAFLWKKAQRGTPPGSMIKVSFLPTEAVISRKEEIVSYLRRIGIEAV